MDTGKEREGENGHQSRFVFLNHFVLFKPCFAVQIARFLPGRVGKQCRERYMNHLDPNLNKVRL
jgi:hypothetical protein